MSYTCNFCREQISFKNRKPLNTDGTPHRCRTQARMPVVAPPATDNHAAVVFALGAMNAIINGLIQAGGVDHIHRMNFHDVADASWQASVAMMSAERNYRDEIDAIGRGA